MDVEYGTIARIDPDLGPLLEVPAVNPGVVYPVEAPAGVNLAQLLPGDRMLVGFIGGDPDRPIVLAVLG